MKSVFAFAFTLAMSISAFAYKDGTYSCKNINGLPNNVYKIQTIDLGQGASLPYMEVTLYFHAKPIDPNSPVREARHKGFANIVSTGEGAEMLLLASMSFEFKNDELLRCKQ